MIKKIKDFMFKRKVRRLAERILAHQLVMSSEDNAGDMAVKAIATARLFYYKWNGGKIK